MSQEEKESSENIFALGEKSWYRPIVVGLTGAGASFLFLYLLGLLTPFSFFTAAQGLLLGLVGGISFSVFALYGAAYYVSSTAKPSTLNPLEYLGAIFLAPFHLVLTFLFNPFFTVLDVIRYRDHTKDQKTALTWRMAAGSLMGVTVGVIASIFVLRYTSFFETVASTLSMKFLPGALPVFALMYAGTLLFSFLGKFIARPISLKRLDFEVLTSADKKSQLATSAVLNFILNPLTTLFSYSDARGIKVASFVSFLLGGGIFAALAFIGLPFTPPLSLPPALIASPLSLPPALIILSAYAVGWACSILGKWITLGLYKAKKIPGKQRFAKAFFIHLFFGETCGEDQDTLGAGYINLSNERAAESKREAPREEEVLRILWRDKAKERIDAVNRENPLPEAQADFLRILKVILKNELLKPNSKPTATAFQYLFGDYKTNFIRALRKTPEAINVMVLKITSHLRGTMTPRESFIQAVKVGSSQLWNPAKVEDSRRMNPDAAISAMGSILFDSREEAPPLFIVDTEFLQFFVNAFCPTAITERNKRHLLGQIIRNFLSTPSSNREKFELLRAGLKGLEHEYTDEQVLIMLRIAFPGIEVAFRPKAAGGKQPAGRDNNDEEEKKDDQAADQKVDRGAEKEVVELDPPDAAAQAGDSEAPSPEPKIAARVKGGFSFESVKRQLESAMAAAVSPLQNPAAPGERPLEGDQGKERVVLQVPERVEPAPHSSAPSIPSAGINPLAFLPPPQNEVLPLSLEASQEEKAAPPAPSPQHSPRIPLAPPAPNMLVARG